MSLVDLVGMAGSLVSVVLWLPQAQRTWSIREDASALAGLSSGTQWLVVLNAIIWLAYAGMTGAHWVGLPGLVTLPLALGTIWFIHRAKRGPHWMRLGQAEQISSPSTLCSAHHLDAESPEQTCGHNMALPHKIVVVSPPGYGTVLDCNGQRRWDAVLMVPQEP